MMLIMAPIRCSSSLAVLSVIRSRTASEAASMSISITILRSRFWPSSQASTGTSSSAIARGTFSLPAQSLSPLTVKP